MKKQSKFWLPRKNSRNVWLVFSVILFISGILDLNNIILGDIPWVLIQLGFLSLIGAHIEDLRYRFYRKFEVTDKEEPNINALPSEKE